MKVYTGGNFYSILETTETQLNMLLRQITDEYKAQLLALLSDAERAAYERRIKSALHAVQDFKTMLDVARAALAEKILAEERV